MKINTALNIKPIYQLKVRFKIKDLNKEQESNKITQHLHLACISWVFHIKHKLYNGQKIRINVEIKTCKYCKICIDGNPYRSCINNDRIRIHA